MSTLADFIGGDLTLPVAFKPADVRISFFKVLGADACIHPGTPKLKAFFLQLASHHCNHFRFRQPKLKFDGFKRGAIFPGHFDDPINFDISEIGVQSCFCCITRHV